MLRTRLLTATAAVALFAAGSAFAQTAPAPTAEATTTVQATTPATTNTVVDVLRADGHFTTLLAALDAAQLTDTLKTQPAISIFAPTDAAFAALSEEERTRLMDPANVNDLRQLLLYHVIVADVNSSQIEGTRGGVETAARTEVQLDGTGDAIKVDNATVTTADLDASNGAVFAIDHVLNPAESQVASGDAEDDTAIAPEETDAPAATPPVEADADAAVAVDETTTDAAEGEVAPPPSDAVTTPSATTTTTTTTRSPGVVRAPNGQPATTVTTTASPPVPNPTDGQVDDEDAGDDAPTPQS